MVKAKAVATPSLTVGTPPKPESLEKDTVAFLVQPTETSVFDSDFWEKAPLYAPATTERRALFQNLFDVEELKAYALKKEKDDEADEEEEEEDLDEEEDEEDEEDDDEAPGPLLFGEDLNAARYIDGAKQIPEDQMATEEAVSKLFKEGYTFQVLQPQRMSDGIWRLVSALERQMGCLVGCNAYITPEHTQGLAPHHDDVELFICQTQGSKRWKLYKPLAGFELPNKSSQDLPQEMIGEPVMDVTLQVGDVLYLPRGTIHQAVAQEGGSTHLTLSTYQNWTWGSFAASVINTALAAQGEVEGVALPMELRKSLPRGFLSSCGLQAELKAGQGATGKMNSSTAASTLAAGLRALADALEDAEDVLLPAAVDNFAADFIRARIRPHPALLPDQGVPPTSLDDCLIGRGDGLFMIVPVEGPADDPESPEGFVKLCTPLQNTRYYHMMRTRPGDDDDDEGEDEDEDEDEDGGEAKGDKASAHASTPADHVHDGCCGHKKLKRGEEEKEGEDDDKDEGEDEDDDDDSEGSEDDDTNLPGPMIPAAYAPLVAEILATTAAPGIKLRDLVAKAPHQDEEEVMHLAFSLWRNGFVCTLPAAPVKAVGSKQAAGKKGKAEAKPAKTEVKEVKPAKAEVKEVKPAKTEVKEVKAAKAEVKEVKAAKAEVKAEVKAETKAVKAPAKKQQGKRQAPEVEAEVPQQKPEAKAGKKARK